MVNLITKNFCCDKFFSAYNAGHIKIFYHAYANKNARNERWVLKSQEIGIDYCPWCAAKLDDFL